MICVIRNPFAVAKSLHVRDKIPIVEGLRLWKVYNSHLLEAAQTHDVPILYFINDKEDFENAVKKALISVFPDEVERGVLTLAKIGDFLSRDLVHHDFNINHDFFNHLIESGLKNDESEEIDLLWQSLLDLTLNSPKTDPKASKPTEEQHFPQKQPMQTMESTPPESIDFETSLKTLNEQIANSTGQTTLWRQGVELFFKNDRKADLLTWIELHLKEHPDEPYLLFELAKLYWDAGDRFHAIEIIENCVLLAPGWIPALKYLADWYQG